MSFSAEREPTPARQEKGRKTTDDGQRTADEWDSDRTPGLTRNYEVCWPPTDRWHLRQATSGGKRETKRWQRATGQDDIVLVVIIVISPLDIFGHLTSCTPRWQPHPQLATQVQASFMRRIQVLLSLLVAGKVSQTQIENAPPHFQLLILVLVVLLMLFVLVLVQLLCDLQCATFIWSGTFILR